MTFDEWHHPIPHKVFDVGFVVTDLTSVDFLHFIEPWAKSVFVDNWDVAEEYIKKEQPTTKLQLDTRIFKAGAVNFASVLLYFSEKDFMQNPNENSAIITKLNDILSEGVEDNSEYELGIFKLKTRRVIDIAPNMVRVV